MQNGVESLQIAYHVSGDAQLDVLGELASVDLLILLGQRSHVVADVTAHDVFAVDVGVELLALGIVAWEALVAV